MTCDGIGGNSRAAGVNGTGRLYGRSGDAAVHRNRQVAALSKHDIAAGGVGGIEVDAGDNGLGGKALAGDQRVAGTEDLAADIHATACGRRASGAS